MSVKNLLWQDGDIVDAVSSGVQIRVDFLGGRIKVE